MRHPKHPPTTCLIPRGGGDTKVANGSKDLFLALTKKSTLKFLSWWIWWTWVSLKEKIKNLQSEIIAL